MVRTICWVISVFHRTVWDSFEQEFPVQHDEAFRLNLKMNHFYITLKPFEESLLKRLTDVITPRQ